MYYFNPKNFGFYLEKGEGLIAITDEVYRYLLDGQSEGNQIVMGDDGKPTLKPIEITEEEAILVAYSQRDRLLGMAALRIAPLQDAVDLDDATAEDIANLRKWKQYRVALSRINEQEGFPKDISWPSQPE